VGIKVAAWQESLLDSLMLKGIDAALYYAGNACFIRFKGHDQLVLNLIPLLPALAPEDLKQLQSVYLTEGVMLVQLWEDIWLNRPLQVLSRISSMLGRNSTVHGRKTKVKSVTQTDADHFFDHFHLQGSASARYKYALTLGEEVVAMASFSAKRKMTRRAREGYTSVELIRFATIDGITVQGGLSKLIRHLVKTIAPNDVMTYTDMDWSSGKGYVKLGFELADTSAPAEIWLDTANMTRYFPHRLPDELRSALSLLSPDEAAAYMKSKNYIRIFNTGNLKYILPL